MNIPNWLKRKNRPEPKPFKPSLPLTWWIDDLSHEVCGLVDDPKRGLKDMPWPDCDKVYLAVDKTAYDEQARKLKLAIHYFISLDATNMTTNQQEIVTDAINQIGILT